MSDCIPEANHLHKTQPNQLNNKTFSLLPLFTISKHTMLSGVPIVCVNLESVNFCMKCIDKS